MTNPTLTDSNLTPVPEFNLNTRFLRATNEVAWKVAPGTYQYKNFPLVTRTDDNGEPVVELKSGHITVEHTSYVFVSLTNPSGAPTVLTCEYTLAQEMEAEQQRKAAARAARFERFMEKHAVLVGSPR